MLITGGILRPISNKWKQPAQNRNIEWFYNIMHDSEILRKISDKSPEIFTINQSEFDDIYQDLELEISLENWIKIITGNINQEQKEALYYNFDRIFKGHDIIVGYEMPDILMEYLDESGYTYVNFILHPVRFYKDLIFAFRTNNENLFYMFTRELNFINNDDLYRRLNVERAKLSRLHDLYIPPNSCLLIGQTSIDRSLVYGNKILSFNDYRTEIHTLFTKYNRVYFKPHPYEDISSYNLPDEVIISQDNTYNLMFQPNIECIYSISSSICYEAQFLNKKSEYFYKMPYDIDNGENSVYNKDMYYGFYSDDKLIYGYSEGDLRRSLCHEWSYKIFREIEES